MKRTNDGSALLNVARLFLICVLVTIGALALLAGVVYADVYLIGVTYFLVGAACFIAILARMAQASAHRRQRVIASDEGRNTSSSPVASL